MVLVRVGDRRVDDVAAVTEAVALAQLVDVIGRGGRIEAVGHDDDALGIGAEGVDDGPADVLAGNGDDRRPADRERHDNAEVPALEHGQIVGERAVLDVVDRQQDRPG